MTQFIEDPSADLDLGCLETLREVDFRGSFQLANLTMGTDDLWEDDESIVGAAITQPDPDLVRAIEEARSGALGW